MSEKTEAPTSRRLAEAREEGRVARSQEINVAVALLAGAWLLTSLGRRLLADLQGLLVGAISALPGADLSEAGLRALLIQDGRRIGADLGFILAGLLFSGVLATVAQTGFVWSTKRLGFDFSRVNPLNGLKRLFSGQGMMELVKALVKLAVVSWTAYSFLRSRGSELLGLAQTDFLSSVSHWTGMASALMLRVGGVYLAVALADYGYQRWILMKSLRMTREEIKEEMKRSEGDPMIKSRIRSQQRRMARMRMMANVPKADVVITNPTHLAVAVQYNSESMQAPKLLAKGAHLTAQRIADIAREHNIPVIQNVPLARAIYKTVEIDQEIPPELYIAMAEVLAYVYGMRGMVPAMRTS